MIEHSSLNFALKGCEGIDAAFSHIERSSCSYRIPDYDRTKRKLGIPFGRHTIHVVLFSMESETLKFVTATRRQLRDDFLR